MGIDQVVCECIDISQIPNKILIWYFIPNTCSYLLYSYFIYQYFITIIYIYIIFQDISYHILLLFRHVDTFKESIKLHSKSPTSNITNKSCRSRNID